MNKFPSFSQWKQIFKVLTKFETLALATFGIAAIASMMFLLGSLYYDNTVIVPALGGTHTEGIVGQPRFINPIYGETNDVDRSLIGLVFSGLITYDAQGSLVKDLAKDYTISDDGRTYTFHLKDNILWHDGKPLTADDVVFTIKTIQNSDYKSPMRANWIGVGIEKTSEKTLVFTLPVAYNSFLETLAIKIIPKHIWEAISPENFTLSPYNLQPIGSGPYQFSNINQQPNTGFITGINLKSNRKYYHQPAHIANLNFQFFETAETLTKAVNARVITGFALAPYGNNQALAEENIPNSLLGGSRFLTYPFTLPRYFAVFFNIQKDSLLADINIRRALSHAVDKTSLVAEINNQTKNDTTVVDSPILPDFFEYQQPASTYEYNQAKAAELLTKAGFLDNGSGRLEKIIKKQPAFQFTSYLKIGSKGTAVTQLQQCLAGLDDNFKTLLAPDATGTFGKGTDLAVTAFQQKYLPDLKSTGETGESTRKKLNELCTPPSSNSQILSVTLTTLDQSELVQTANQLKTYWQAVGVTVTINALSATDIKQAIKNRAYEALLYGEELGAEPDLYPFWHSAQRLDPGLNLSSYQNKDADKLLESARKALAADVKQRDYEKLQNIVIADAPALFLYNPSYIYWVSKNVQGIETQKIIDPAERFINITNWFIKTKRTWK